MGGRGGAGGGGMGGGRGGIGDAGGGLAHFGRAAGSDPGEGGPGMGGATGVFGAQRAANDQPHYVQTNQLIVVASPEGDAVTAYSTETGKSKSLRLTKATDAKLRVNPILSDGLAALNLKGPHITRIAAFSKYDGNWYAQDLREPVEQARPIVGATMAAYPIGRRAYAFSALAKRWDVLELPVGTVANVSVGPDAITCPHSSHLYVFSAKTGTWEDIDTRAIPAGKDEKGVSN
jgi:hypothetical protein